VAYQGLNVPVIV